MQIPNLEAQASSRFGSLAVQTVLRWETMIGTFANADTQKKLVAVNDFFNQTSEQGISFNILGDLIGDTLEEGYDLFKMSGFKYAILILLEVVIFHFARKTLEILTGEKAEANLSSFIKASDIFLIFIN